MLRRRSTRRKSVAGKKHVKKNEETTPGSDAGEGSATARQPLGVVDANVMEADKRKFQDAKTCDTIRFAMSQAMARKAGFSAFRRSFHLNGNSHAMSRQRSGSNLDHDDVPSDSDPAATPPSSAYDNLEDNPQPSHAHSPALGANGSFSNAMSHHERQAVQMSPRSDAGSSSTDNSFSDASMVMVCDAQYDETRAFSKAGSLAMTAALGGDDLCAISEDAELELSNCDHSTLSISTDSISTGHTSSHVLTAASPSPSSATHSTSQHMRARTPPGPLYQSQQQSTLQNGGRARKKPPTPRHPRWRIKSNAFRVAELNRVLDTELTASTVAQSVGGRCLDDNSSDDDEDAKREARDDTSALMTHLSLPTSAQI